MNLVKLNVLREKSLPTLKSLAERIQNVVPDCKIKPGVFERIPESDRFISSNLKKNTLGEVDTIVDESINTVTNRIEGRIKTIGDDGTSRYVAEMFDSEGRVIADMNTQLGGYANEYIYDGANQLIERKTIFARFPRVRTEKFKNGKNIYTEDIALGKTDREIVNPDGSKIRTYIRDINNLNHENIGKSEIVQNVNSSGKVTNVVQTLNGKTISTMEVNPETGNIVKLSVPDNYTYITGQERRLDINFDEFGYCKKVEITDAINNEKLYEATYDLGIRSEETVNRIHADCKRGPRIRKDGNQSNLEWKDYFGLWDDSILTFLKPEVKII